MAEYFRELREEIKTTTDEMWQNAKPLQGDPSEETCEFVELVSVDSHDKPHKRDTKEQKKSPKIYSRLDMLTPAQLKDEMTRQLGKVKATLMGKKAICAQLAGRSNDETIQGVSTIEALGNCDDSDNSDSSDSEPHNKTSPDPQVGSRKMQQFVDHKQKISGTIQNIQNRVVDMKKSDDPNVVDKHTNSVRVRSDSVSSVKSSTSSVMSKKKQRFNRFSKSPNKPKGSSDRNVTPGPSGSGLSQISVLSENELLLLTLLNLSYTQRELYLVKVCKEHSLLLPSEDPKNHVINPKFSPLVRDLKARALKICYGGNVRYELGDQISRPVLAMQDTEKNQLKKEVRETRTFEDEVTFMLNNGKTTDKKDYKKELTLENVSKAEVNGYLTEPNIAALAELVDRLVAAGVGYLIEGVIRINGRNPMQAFVSDPTRESDVFLSTILIRKCAMEGDLVQVFVMNKENSAQQNEVSDSGEKQCNNWGFVVKTIEKRHSRIFLGTFTKYTEADTQFIRMKPRDVRIPAVRIYKQHWPEALFKNDFKDVETVIYQGEIIEWKNEAPVGTILKSIGKCGELEIENKSILMEYDLDISPYSDAIINSLPPSPFQIPEEETHKRVDLRDECVFTIDPLTARDLDDALSCKMLKNGNYEIGVHISDVSYFLKERSELDELVKLRATSIYMVDNVYHMLPKPLCFLCSLLPGEDKLTFSVFWEITPDAKILQTRFAKTVINSCTQLAYEHAQIMLDKPNENLRTEDFPKIHHGYSPNYISRIVNQLQSVAVQLRARRMQNGCLKIDQPKLTFTVDPKSGKPTAFSVYELKPANQMIEDFMLLANASVAEFTHSKLPNISILRHHLPPATNPMKGLVAFLTKHGHNFRMHTSKAMVESLESIVSSCKHPDAALAAMNVLLAKPMTRANYFCSDGASGSSRFYHFALAIPMYTHFTSPIRRYADCMVHRVLTAALELSDRPTRTPHELSQLANICNEKKYNAKLAGEASSQLYFKLYMRTVNSLDTEAAVLDILTHQVEVVLITTGHVIKVGYRQLAKTTEVKIDKTATPILHFTLIPKDKKMQPADIKLFSKVRVTVQLTKDTLNITHMASVK